MKKVISFFVIIMFIASIIATANLSVSAAAEGSAIVQCALQYVGKVPYVWGGTKIDGANPGADCSGFICRIYEKFGINMWANRSKLRNCGTNLGTDMNVAMLGDIIWYEGHVAIYAGKDSAGNHMIVHETGGNYQNVAYTKHSIVSAKLKGIIRIPGVVNNGQGVEIKKASFSPAVDSSYKAKESISNTNAVIVTQVTKLQGVKVTQMGVYLYDANGKLIKKYSENVSNVGNNTTKYHSWYDINSEVGVTLTPGTTYKYAFYGVFDGQEIKGNTYSFKTTVKAPTASDTAGDAIKTKASFSKATDKTYTDKAFVTDKNACVVIQVNKTAGVRVTQMGLYLYDTNGKLIKKYFENVSNVGDNTTKYHSWYDINSNVGVTLTPSTTYKYAFYGVFDGQEIKSSTYSFKTDNAIEEIPENEICKVTFIMNYDNTKTKVVEVEKGSKVGTLPTPIMYSGHEFVGFYTKKTGGSKVTKSTVINKDTTFYPRYEEIDYSNNQSANNSASNGKGTIRLMINNPNMYHNGKQKKIDENGTMPFIHNDRTLLPVRAVIEAMNGTVDWNDKTSTVTLKKDGKTLFLRVDFENAWDINGNVFKLDTPPLVKNGRTMLPIRFIVEYFGGTVDWNEEEQSITISYDE